MLPDYGGQAVKLNDTECVACRREKHLPAAAAAESPRLTRCFRRRYLLYRDEEILGLLKDE